MSHYDNALIEYYITQGADQEQIDHIFNQQNQWK